MTGNTLNPRQRSLQALALRQLEAASETLRRLLTATADQADVEALQDAAGSVAASQGILRDWFGTEPPGG